MVNKLKTYWNRRVVYWKRNEIILNDLHRKANSNCVNLHWYSCGRKDGMENFGDYLAVPIYRYMVNKFNLDENVRLSETKHLYTVGSILFFGRQKATIWGSGLLTYPPEGTKRSTKFELDIRAVRGPETRKILLEEGFKCPEVYGDPAILMPYVYKTKQVEKKVDYSVILHKSNRNEYDKQIPILCHDYREVIDQIVASKKIISTSLHGIIVAEAYGVPAVMLYDDRADFNLLKYNDYYYSTGRYTYPIAKSMEEALEIEPAELPQLDMLREGLINAFPIDLWGNN